MSLPEITNKKNILLSVTTMCWFTIVSVPLRIAYSCLSAWEILWVMFDNDFTGRQDVYEG